MTFPWINFWILIAASVLMPATYIVSLQPKKLQATLGAQTWFFSGFMRTLSNISEGMMALCLLLWAWYPVPGLSTPIFADRAWGIVIALLIGVPFLLLDIWAIWSLGSETHVPHAGMRLKTDGIYAFIRHPQVAFEIPLFALIALALNSWELFVGFCLYFLLYSLVVIPIDEADLIRRYGNAYRKYRKRVGAIIPKLV